MAIVYEKVPIKNAEINEEGIKFEEYRVYIPNDDTKYDRAEWRTKRIEKGEIPSINDLVSEDMDSKLSEDDKGYKFSVRSTGYQMGRGHMYQSQVIYYLTKFCVCPTRFKQSDNSNIELFHRNVIIQEQGFTNRNPYGF